MESNDRPEIPDISRHQKFPASLRGYGRRRRIHTRRFTPCQPRRVISGEEEGEEEVGVCGTRHLPSCLSSAVHLEVGRSVVVKAMASLLVLSVNNVGFSLGGADDSVSPMAKSLL